MIGQTISHYKILEKLGGGGMGVVYKAQDLKLKRAVALKFLPPDLTRDPEAKERFIHEAQAASALDHPNICNIHEVAETADGQTFIVMGCYEGQTLKKKIESGQLEINEVIDIATQVAQGLSRAHEAGIVHRDIKPANIMVTDRGEVKIVDFGLAKLSGRTLLTKSGSTLGTAAYMSPEQARGEAVDARTDLWSLGVVLYEMLTGKRPFESEYGQALVYSILSQDPKPMRTLRPDVPDALEKICRRAMAKDAKERYQTADELIADLESYKEGTQLSQKTRRIFSKRQKIVYAVSAGIVLVAVLVGIYTTAGRGEVFDRIGVLPFRNVSTDTTADVVADAMTDQVIARLQQVASLRVPSARSAMQFKGSKESYATIAGAMRARLLVDASVQRIKDRLRITASLIDPEEDRSMWSETFDGTMDDFFNLQSRIAQAVLREIRANVTPQVQQRLARQERKVNPEAFDLYLRASQEVEQLYVAGPSPAALKNITSKLEKAIELEPDNAMYYCGLGAAYSAATDLGIGNSVDNFNRRSNAVETAVRLDPDLLETQVAMARVESYRGNFAKALEYSARMLELSPGSYFANQHRSLILTSVGRFDEARAIDEGLQDLDPAAFKQTGWIVGQNLYFMRKYDETISFLREWLKSSPPQAVGARYILALVYSMKGMHKEALAQCDSMGVLRGMNRPMFLAKSGNRELALKEMEPFLTGKDTTGLTMDSYGLAQVYAALGERDSTLKYLALARDQYTVGTGVFRIDPYLDFVRDDPRFKEIMKKMNYGD